MPKAPKSLSLMLCDGVQIDTAGPKLSLVGLFYSLRFPSFPTSVRVFTAYALLYGGEGEGRMNLDIKRADTEASCYSNELWRGFAPGVISTAEIKVRKCRFPSPGRYIVTLFFEGEIVAQSVLDVMQE
jgi:hypothetical protein